SATKLAWILDNVDGARASAEAGKLAFGTVDTFLIWRLTGGRSNVTDATNAARTMLFNIHDNDWDADLLALLNIPRSLLPEVWEFAGHFGDTDPALFGQSIAIRGVAGDQQAATLGNACFQPGMVKSTYGTGCFALINTGGDAVASKNRLLTTIAYRLDGVTTYALEGSIFIAGAAVQWLRDGLKIIDHVARSGELAVKADPQSEVVLVPAFTGLGAPHWDPHARGAMFGLTRATGQAEIARATLESVCFQTRDLITAMTDDWSGPGTDAGDTILRVDGGMVQSDWTMQCLADILDAPVDRPTILETTALGAAWLAGRDAGVWPDRDGFAESWRLDRRFESGSGASWACA
ncbi:MAG: FGGY family carbohydrate kinase, partial [Alphaproteobacteria bacterium]